MKKGILFLTLIVSYVSVAQQDNIQKTPSSEIKANLFNLAAYTAVDVAYEYLLNENQSIGVGLLFKLKPVSYREENIIEPEISYNRNFSITPYYRYFFSKKYAKGIFIEGFAMYASGKEFSAHRNDVGLIDDISEEKYNLFRLGIGAGFKIVSRKNLTIDANFGVGINHSGATPFGTISTTRGGISIGYRF